MTEFTDLLIFISREDCFIQRQLTDICVVRNVGALPITQCRVIKRYEHDTRAPNFRRADDGLDRSALPLLSAAVIAARLAVYGDGDDGCDLARQSGQTSPI